MIYLSPLQGLTDYTFRNAHFSTIGGVDKYFAPYISLVQKPQIQRKQKRDIQPDRQMKGIPLVPQIMGADSDQILSLCTELMDLGYNEINWNLGCPYPMVTNRGCGSGAISDIDNIKSVLDKVCSISQLDFSVKMRMGYESSEEFVNLKPTLKQFPLKELIIHPRTGKQLYKGKADRDFFDTHANDFPFPVVYNGDISSKIDGQLLLKKHNNIGIGRGIIANPLLASEIKEVETELSKEEIFWKFHTAILEETSIRMEGGDAQITRKMYEYWQYWAQIFPDAGKEIKKLKKCSKLSNYNHITNQIRNTYNPTV